MDPSFRWDDGRGSGEEKGQPERVRLAFLKPLEEVERQALQVSVPLPGAVRVMLSAFALTE